MARNAALLAACVGGAVLLVVLTDALLAPARRAVVLTVGGVGDHHQHGAMGRDRDRHLCDDELDPVGLACAIR